MKAIGLLAALCCITLAACDTPSKEAVVQLSVYVRTCVDSGKSCFDLGLPDAEVSISASDGTKLTGGKTDQYGQLTLRIGQTELTQVIAISPLIEGGRKQQEIQLTAGSTTDLTMWAPISQSATSPAAGSP